MYLSESIFQSELALNVVSIWSIAMCVNFALNKFKYYNFGGCRVCRTFEIALAVSVVQFYTGASVEVLLTPFIATALYIHTQ